MPCNVSMDTFGTPVNDSTAKLRNRLEHTLGPLKALDLISQNYGFYVHRAETASGRVVVKSGKGEMPGQLGVEARMLADLADDGVLEVPQVLFAGNELLVQEWINTDNGPIRTPHERQAGEAFARLHATPRPYFGYSYATPIGGLPQPNPETSSWVGFFRNSRLLQFTSVALARGAIDQALAARLANLGRRLPDFIPEPAHPALVHGDAWFGNILTRGDTIAAYIDPALHYGSPEIELAYVTMHGTFGAAFFEAYRANAAIEPGFEERIDILNIVPNLVHVILCGRSYIAPIVATLDRLGV